MFKRNPHGKIKYLDAQRFHRALIAGISYVISRQDYLNKINVFPVPDGDTGTNMALTLNAIIEQTTDKPYTNLKELMEDIADAALNSARGNSGAIIAQFFQGLAEATNQEDKLSTAHFAEIIASGDAAARQALSEPIEGTIITIIHAFSKSLLHRVAKGDTDFQHLLHHSLNHTKTALNNTPKQLAVLKKAGVVDAGAQGFVDLLTGIYEFICQGNIGKLMDRVKRQKVKECEHHEEIHADDLKYRFCTECLITGCNIDREALRKKLSKNCDSLIVAGSKKKVKIHIHTNNPADVFEICRGVGQVRGEKADDMLRQAQTNKGATEKVGILIDSSIDVPDELLEKLDIHVIPLTIHFGTQTYIDKITLKPKDFFQKLKESPLPSTTSQPTISALSRQYQYLISHYKNIVAIHLPNILSGTMTGSKKAAEQIDDKHIEVIDSCNLSIAAGLVAQYAARAAKAGLNKDEVVKCTEKAIANTELYAAIPDLTYAVRGGRVKASKKYLSNLLRLTPVLSCQDDGSFAPSGVLYGKNNTAQKLAKFVKKRMQPNKKYILAVGYGESKEDGEELAEAIKDIAADQITECNLVQISAIIGSHSGPDVIGIAIQEDMPLPIPA